MSDQQVGESGIARRRFLAATGALGLSSLAGCTSWNVLASEEYLAAVGEAHDAGDLRIEIPYLEVAEEIVVHSRFSGDERHHEGYVFVIPWLRIENVGDDPVPTFNPVRDVDLFYEGEDPDYEGGRHHEITVGGNTEPTYYAARQDVGTTVPPGGTVEGFGPVYRLPTGFDPTQLHVQITVDEEEYRWVYERADDPEDR